MVSDIFVLILWDKKSLIFGFQPTHNIIASVLFDSHFSLGKLYLINVLLLLVGRIGTC